ncbi:hypothetical protein KHS38_19695 [Mucilaginibacter sp. Bleaf8]|uniref:DUF4440 domain-containing protein n=1 Tax=Mucilaginibacter sp. Bleaf8 TaxID=2834430 RepID=UPI001BCE9910|nr:DUF4440 domain-containing protein [Mucilaginibacter sp. Bleaf8]MBS7566639.1 hypothetical protein [Mucilaginibacter sp. Bleaf8]
MNKALSAIAAICCYAATTLAQTTGTTQTAIKTEEDFNKLAARKGIKEAFLSVADPEGLVFKPEPVKITDFYGNIDKQPGTLTWQPKFARISASGDLAVTAGPYVYTAGKASDDKVFGDYVSIWRGGLDNKLKLLFQLGIQHPESDAEPLVDVKEPDAAKANTTTKDPFKAKAIIMSTDKALNATLQKSSLVGYKAFCSPEAHYYFPGFQPITGQDKVLQFLSDQAISISAETVNAGRSNSNDLAYSYGRARIRKGNIVSNYNYVRVWEMDAQNHWNVLLEILSAVENE